MAKGQNRGNREAKKPKQVKVVAPVAAAGLLARVTTPSKKKG